MTKRAEKRIKELRNQILAWSDSHYNTDEDVVPDSVFDSAMRTLRELEDKYPQYAEEKPVGTPPRQDDVVEKHAAPMLSLDNIFKLEDLYQWMERQFPHIPDTKQWLFERKYDGLSISLTYRYGKLTMAQLRGDGEQGIVVTGRAKLIRTIPDELTGEFAAEEQLTVRGEVIVPRSCMERINQERGKDYTTPRSAAAGGLRGGTITPAMADSLQFYPYEVFSGKRDYLFDTHSAAMEALQSVGFTVDEPIAVHCSTMTALIESDMVPSVLSSLKETIDNGDVECDGIVVKVDAVDAWGKLGSNSHHPNYMTAYKFQEPGVLTKLTEVKWQVGRTGVVTPVGIITPTVIGGVTVTRCTLHNPVTILNNKLAIGDVISVIRSGEVIPKFISRTSKPQAPSKRIQVPGVCGHCGTGLVMVGPKAYCPGGAVCMPQRENAIVHYGSRKAMNIHGLGPSVVQTLITTAQVTGLSDLYEMSEGILVTVLGEGTAKNLLSEIEAKKKTTPEKLLYALGIPRIGMSSAKALIEHFGSVSSVLTATISDLLEVVDIGTERANAIHEYYDNPFNRINVERLLNYLNLESAKSDGILDGKTFAITGSFIGASRDDIKEQLESRGGTFVNGVSGKVTHLLVGEKPSPSKTKKAEELGIPILNAIDLHQLLE